MTEGEFPFRSFTLRSEGYDRTEVDGYVGELQSEVVELRRALDTATTSESHQDTRLHDPEGAVTRTLAIAQETADRVLHDAQVEADRRRSEADEHATTTIAEADERASRLLAEIETQAAEVREQGVAAARSAIKVERDKAMAELAHVRRIRDDLRAEAVDLKAALDRYRGQAREASDSLAAAASGPLMALDLPDFVDDEVMLAGIESDTDEDHEFSTPAVIEPDDDSDDSDDTTGEDDDAPAPALGHLRSVAVVDDLDEADDDFFDVSESADAEPGADDDDGLAKVISIEADPGHYEEPALDFEVASDLDDDLGSGSGAFLSEIQAAADDDAEALAPENDDSDRFLSELREIADDEPELDSEAADTFFDD